MEEKRHKAPLVEELSYWKAHISVHDVLASELSYSLIYDNIHPDKVADALDTVGLTVLPNRFLLIQVDDYQNYASKLRLTQEYFQKTSLINMLRSCMQTRGLRGFVANLIGQDNVICFLCCQEQEGPDIKDFLLSVAESFKQSVRSKSAYTISVCISGQCTRLSQYSQMYPRMNLALSKTYFTGKEFSILLDEAPREQEESGKSADLNEYYLELLAAIARRSGEQFEQTMQNMIKDLLELQLRPQKSRLEMVRLLQRIEEYCIRCGVPESRIRPHTETAAGQVLACSFLTDALIYFRGYYEQVVRALEAYSTDGGYSFRLPVEEYIAEHYPETVRLGDLAALIGFSEGHFARTFRQHFGMSFVQYLTEYRIRRSKALLADTQIPIEQIAYRVGINSYSYFCTCFKRSCGVSPGTYRRQSAARRQEPEGETP